MRTRRFCWRGQTGAAGSPGQAALPATVFAGDHTGLALPGDRLLQCSKFVFSVAEPEDDLPVVMGAQRNAAGPGLCGPCPGCQKPDRELECCGGRKVMAEHLPRLWLWWGFEPAGGLVGAGIRGLQGEGTEPSLTANATAGTGWCSHFSVFNPFFWVGAFAGACPCPASSARLGEAESGGDKYFSLAFKEGKEILFA